MGKKKKNRNKNKKHVYGKMKKPKTMCEPVKPIKPQ